MTKNQKKVILCRIGDFEVYVYPYDYPDSVFIGKFPTNTQIDSGSINQLLRAYNMSKSFINGVYFEKDTHRNGANFRRRNIKQAYNRALNEKRAKK